MSDTLSATAAAAAPDQRRDCITIPAGYKIWSWKVHDGSSVSVGETIAMAVPASRLEGNVSTSSSTVPVSATTTPATSQHKRPQRKKKGGTTAIANMLASIQSTKEDKSTTLTAPPDVTPVVASRNGIFRRAETEASTTIVEAGVVVTTTAAAAAPLMIGYIEDCQHPTVIEGLCAVCGLKIEPKRSMDDYSSNNSNSGPTGGGGGLSGSSASSNALDNGHDTSNTMTRMTVAGHNVSVSHAEGQRMAQQDTLRLRKLRKLSLVLDLDHTLVHATADPRAEAHHQPQHRTDVRNLILPIVPIGAGTIAATTTATQPSRSKAQQVQQQQQQQVWFQRHFVKIRPYVTEFLQGALPHFEIGVYTAGTREYAEQIAILIARHLVGSRHDQVELDQLRQHVAFLSQQQVLAQQRNKQPAPKEKRRVAATAGEEPENNGMKKGTNSNHFNMDTKNPSSESSNDDSSSSASTDTINGHDSDDTVVAEATTVSTFGLDVAMNGDGAKPDKGGGSNKRKRVTFDELPKVERPVATAFDVDALERLQAELAAAERLEAQAMEMRQRLFGSRVVSRTEVGDLGRDVKSLKRIFPCGGSMAAVIDDREDVWANAEEMTNPIHTSANSTSGTTPTSTVRRRGEPPENLLLVRPYHWSSFLGFADVNNASGADLSQGTSTTTAAPPKTESDTDEQLLWTANILKRLHDRYYSFSGMEDRPSVPEVLQQMRREVLSNCVIVLSGLVPLDKQGVNKDNTNTPRPPFVRYAESLGATVQSSIDATVTHVVGNRDGTDKIMAARRLKHCHVVKASWLVECFWSLTRRDEAMHALQGGGRPGGVGGPRLSTTPKKANSGTTIAAGRRVGKLTVIPYPPSSSSPLPQSIDNAHVADLVATAAAAALPLSSVDSTTDTAENTNNDDEDDDENDDDFADELADEFLNEDPL